MCWFPALITKYYEPIFIIIRITNQKTPTPINILVFGLILLLQIMLFVLFLKPEWQDILIKGVAIHVIKIVTQY